MSKKKKLILSTICFDFVSFNENKEQGLITIDVHDEISISLKRKESNIFSFTLHSLHTPKSDNFIKTIATVFKIDTFGLKLADSTQLILRLFEDDFYKDEIKLGNSLESIKESVIAGNLIHPVYGEIFEIHINLISSQFFLVEKNVLLRHDIIKLMTKK